MEELEPQTWEPARQCTATSRSGERCRRQPIPGGTVCAVHGGKAPQTVAAAKLRLLEAVEPAIARLLRFIETPPGLCDVCGRSDDTAAIVSAIRTVLDRAGLGPTATMQVTTTEPSHGEYADMSEDELIAHLEETLESARAIRDLKQRQFDAIDAVVVDDGVFIPEDDSGPEAGTPHGIADPVVDDPNPRGIGSIEDGTDAK